MPSETKDYCLILALQLAFWVAMNETFGTQRDETSNFFESLMVLVIRSLLFWHCIYRVNIIGFHQRLAYIKKP